jgi:hypothetical protein
MPFVQVSAGVAVSPTLSSFPSALRMTSMQAKMLMLMWPRKEVYKAHPCQHL